MKRYKFIVPAVLVILVTVHLLSRTTTQLIGVNDKIKIYEIPVYLKLYNFYGRYLNYIHIIDSILKDAKTDVEKVVAITKWVNNNVKKLPTGVDFVDSHPLTIAERRLGRKQQFSDLLSVLLVQADVESFFWVDSENKDYVLTFFRVDDSWSVVDPYYGLLFINKDRNLSSIEDLKAGNWRVFSLNMNEISDVELKEIYNVEDGYFRGQIYKIPTSKVIEGTRRSELGGRSFSQHPLGRMNLFMENALSGF